MQSNPRQFITALFADLSGALQGCADFRLADLTLGDSRWMSLALGWIAPLLFGCYAFYFRVEGIAEHFQMFGDQIRDWKIVSGSFFELPLVGTPRVGGGYSLGPVFYWVLWSARAVFGSLPHAGGVGVALLYGISAAALLHQSLRSFPVVAAFAFCFFVVSSPFEASFSGNTAWNPGVSVSFVNFAGAAFFAYLRRPSPSRAYLTTIFAWLALQSHFPSIFFVVSILGAVVLVYVLSRRPADSGRLLCGILGIIALLQLPMAAHYWTHGAAVAEETVVSGGFWQILSDPSALRISTAFAFLREGVGLLVFANSSGVLQSPWLMYLPFALSLLWIRRSWPLFFLTVTPSMLAIIGYAVVPGVLNHYWLVTLLLSFAAAVVFGIYALPAGFARSLLLLMICAAVLIDQPVRARRAPADRMPGYGALRTGTLAIQDSGRAFREIAADFVDPRSDASFIAESLGLRPHSSATHAVEILEDGQLRWSAVDP